MLYKDSFALAVRSHLPAIWDTQPVDHGWCLRSPRPAYGRDQVWGTPNDWRERLRDPASGINKKLPIHGWVHWVAGFSAHFASDCFDCFLKPSAGRIPVVLDPFAGVGTTLVEALQKGYQAVGCEINPFAMLAGRVKLDASVHDAELLHLRIEDYRRFAARKPSSLRPIPEGFRTRQRFFSPQVQSQVCAFLDFVDDLNDPSIAALFRTALGAEMVSFSNYTYGPSLGARKSAVEEADVAARLIGKLERMLEDIRGVRWTAPDARLYACDFLESEQLIGPESVDLIVTSPPYLNNYHYIRNTRPQLFWLELANSPTDLKFLERAHLGGYWQTVRSGPRVDLEFRHPSLERTLRRLRRTRPEAKSYGGAGWANYAACYFNDCLRFLRRTKAVLRPGSVAVIVVGNSIIQGHEIRTDRILTDLAQEAGLSLHGLLRLRDKRVGASITRSSRRQGNRSAAGLYESVLVVGRDRTPQASGSGPR